METLKPEQKHWHWRTGGHWRSLGLSITSQRAKILLIAQRKTWSIFTSGGFPGVSKRVSDGSNPLFRACPSGRQAHVASSVYYFIQNNL